MQNGRANRQRRPPVNFNFCITIAFYLSVCRGRVKPVLFHYMLTQMHHSQANRGLINGVIDLVIIMIDRAASFSLYLN